MNLGKDLHAYVEIIIQAHEFCYLQCCLADLVSDIAVWHFGGRSRNGMCVCERYHSFEITGWGENPNTQDNVGQRTKFHLRQRLSKFSIKNVKPSRFQVIIEFCIMDALIQKGNASLMCSWWDNLISSTYSIKLICVKRNGFQTSSISLPWAAVTKCKALSDYRGNDLWVFRSPDSLDSSTTFILLISIPVFNLLQKSLTFVGCSDHTTWWTILAPSFL